MRNSAVFRSNGRGAALWMMLALAAFLLNGCDYFPRDPAHSLDDIRSRGTIRVGAPQQLPPEAGRLLDRLERATGAKAQLSAGQLEPLLQQLEHGQIDLVIAPFKKDTPWTAMSALSPTLRTEGNAKAPIEWRAAMRNGENRWIVMVETNARKVARPADGA